MVKRKPLQPVDGNVRKIRRKRCDVKKVDWSKVGVEYFSDDSAFTFLTDPKPIPKTGEKPKNKEVVAEQEKGTFSTRKTPKVSNCSNRVVSAASTKIRMGTNKPIAASLSLKLPAKCRKNMKANKKGTMKPGSSVASLGTIYEADEEDNESLPTSPESVPILTDQKLPNRAHEDTQVLEPASENIIEKENLFFQKRNEQDTAQQLLCDLQADAPVTKQQKLPEKRIADDDNSDMDESWGEDMLEMTMSPPDNELEYPGAAIATEVDCQAHITTTRSETVEDTETKSHLPAGFANFESKPKSDSRDCSDTLEESITGKNICHRTQTSDHVEQELGKKTFPETEYNFTIVKGVASDSKPPSSRKIHKGSANNFVFTKKKQSHPLAQINVNEDINNLDVNDDVSSKHSETHVYSQTFQNTVEVKSDVHPYKPDNESVFNAIMAKELHEENKVSLVGMVVKTPAHESDTSSVDESILTEEDFFLTDQKLRYQRRKQRNFKIVDEHELLAFSEKANCLGDDVHFDTPRIVSRNDCQLPKQANKLPYCFEEDLAERNSGTMETTFNNNRSPRMNEMSRLQIDEASDDELNIPSNQKDRNDGELSENIKHLQDHKKSQQECSNARRLSSKLSVRAELDSSLPHNNFGSCNGPNKKCASRELTTPLPLRKPAVWTAEQARRRCEALGTNIAPVFKLSDGVWFRHPVLPPGWTMVVSRSKNIPYYMHPDFGVTFYCPVPLPSDDGIVKGTTLFYCLDTPASSLASGDTRSESYSQQDFSTELGSENMPQEKATRVSTELEKESPSEQSCIVDQWLQTPKSDEKANESSKTAEEASTLSCTRENDISGSNFYEQQHTQNTPTVLNIIQTPIEEKEGIYSCNRVQAETVEKVSTNEYPDDLESTIKEENIYSPIISDGSKLQDSPMQDCDDDFVLCENNEEQSANLDAANDQNSNDCERQKKNTPSQIVCIAYERAQRNDQEPPTSPLESDAHGIFTDQANHTASINTSSSTCTSDPDFHCINEEIMDLSPFPGNQDESPTVKSIQDLHSTPPENEACNLTAVQIGQFNTDRDFLTSKVFDESPVLASSLPVRVIFGTTSDDDDISRLDGSPIAMARFRNSESMLTASTWNAGRPCSRCDSQSLASNSTGTSRKSYRALNPKLPLCALQNVERLPRHWKGFSIKKKCRTKSKPNKRGRLVT